MVEGPQIVFHANTITTYDVGDPCPGFIQACKCGVVKPVNRILITIALLIHANSNADLNPIKKNKSRFASSQKDRIILIDVFILVEMLS